MIDPDRLALSLAPATVSAIKPHVLDAAAAFERLGDALGAVKADPSPENKAAAREAHDALRDAQHAFGRTLAGEGYRVDREHSWVVRNALTTMKRDFGLPDHPARAVCLRLIDSPPFAEDRLPLPDDLARPWFDALGVIPA